MSQGYAAGTAWPWYPAPACRESHAEARMSGSSGMSSRTEVKPEGAADRVFLTPRVVDAGALEEYAGQLRALLAEAASREESLRAAGREVAAIGEALAETVKTLRGSLEQGPGAASVESIREIVRMEMANVSVANVPAMGGEVGSRVEAARAAVEAAADDAVIRVSALSQQVLAAGTAAQTRLHELEAAESAARSACTELGAALAQAERRAQTIATGIEACLADGARRSAEATPAPDTAKLQTLVQDATRVGDALARLIAQADAVGRALAALSNSTGR